MAARSDRRGVRAPQWPQLRRIAQVMQPRVVEVRRDDPLAAAVAALHRHGARYAAVVNGADIEGVLAASDLDALVWMVRGSSAWMTELVVEDVMRTPPLLLAPDASLAHAGRLLREGSRDCVVVISEGRPVGVVTRDELLGLPTALPRRASVPAASRRHP